MAKIQIDSKISSLITLKSLFSNLKLNTNIIAFDSDSGMSTHLIYMVPSDNIGECFGILYDHELISASNEFHHRLINLVETVGFNKALKKTKTKVSIKDDTIFFETDGYQDTLSLPFLKDYSDITKMYTKLFKDKEITKQCISVAYSDTADWTYVSESNLEKLKNNELVVIYTNTGNPMFISKSIFGGLKKAKSLSHIIIQSDIDSDLVLFKQEEDGYNIYKLIRYLTNL